MQNHLHSLNYYSIYSCAYCKIYINSNIIYQKIEVHFFTFDMLFLTLMPVKDEKYNTVTVAKRNPLCNRYVLEIQKHNFLYMNNGGFATFVCACAFPKHEEKLARA